jgi:GH3 auxin-responsive promoter
MSLSSILIKFVTKGSAKRFEQATLDPTETQKQKLLSIVRKNEQTEYGRRYNFSSIQNISDYQKNVPIVKYEDFRAEVDKIIDGEKNVLTAEDPVMFAQTSGTTGTAKYIPVTPTCQGREHSDVARTWIYHIFASHKSILGGKIVSLVSPAIEGYTELGVPFGSTSGHMYKNMPGSVSKTYSIPYEAFEISNYQSKYYAIMRISLEDDVRMLGTANPSSVMKMCEKGNEFGEEIIRDIRDGTLSRSFEIEPQIRDFLEKRFKPNPQKAKFLEKARSQRNGVLMPADYWPNLALICCWKGGTVGHYLEKYPQWFSPDGDRQIPVRDLGYLSSEARGSIPLSDEGSAGVLTVATNFYEFVEVEDLMANPENPGSWTYLTTEQLEDGKEYYIYVTTTGGLYRYDINDIIKVEGFYNKTPQIIFLRKGRGMTNITGEKLSVNQIIDAFQQVSDKTGNIPAHFKAEADTENSRYVFRVEFVKRIEAERAKEFLSGLDEYLKKVNIEYKSKRDSFRLANPLMHIMREGWYERGRKELIESGKRAFQVKTQILSPLKQQTMEIKTELEEIIEM